MPSLEQKTEALKCVPSMEIHEVLPEIASAPGVAHVQVYMSFLFGSTSSRYYYDMEEAIDGSYSHLRLTVYDVCRMIEMENDANQ
jgi:hypothetical protein